MGIRVGIDLGATYSKIAYVDKCGYVTAIENAEGTRMTPSVVNFTDFSHITVGFDAKEDAIIDPENTILFVKRLIGKTDSAINYNGKEILPEEVLSYIIKKLVADATEILGEEIDGAVITVPTYFCARECAAVRRAAELAGINLINILTETTAAAISYGFCQNDVDRTFLIYDLGGSSLDICVAKATNGKVNVICSGSIELGGIDWDNALIEYLKEELFSKTGIEDLGENILHDLRVVAERAKMKLSARDSTSVILRAAGECTKLEITRKIFEEITSGVLERSIEKTDEVLCTALKIGHKIDEIILVGGGSRMPQVRQVLFDKYGLLPKLYEPDLAIAKGAAIYAMIDKAIDVSPVCSKSYGIKIIRDGKEICHNFIVKNTPFQGKTLSISNTVGVTSSDLWMINLMIYESDSLEDYLPINDKMIMGTLSFHVPNIQSVNVFIVKFNLSIDGVLEVICVDRETGVELASKRFWVNT